MSANTYPEVFMSSQKVRDALAAEANPDCEHNIEDAPSDGIDDSRTGRKMWCSRCGVFFGYHTVEHIPVKVTEDQAEKIVVQAGQQKLAYNATIAYLCGLLKEGLADTKDGKAGVLDATRLIPYDHALYNELTRWRQDDVRFSRGDAVLQMAGVSDARQAVKAHIKSWYKAYRKVEYCKANDRKASKRAGLLTAVPVWKPRGIKILHSDRLRKTLFRTRRQQSRQNKTVLTVAEGGYYIHDNGLWHVPTVGKILSRKRLPDGLIPLSFQVIERPDETGHQQWRINATVLLRIPDPASRDDIV